MSVKIGDRVECGEALISAQNKTEMKLILVIGGHIQDGHPLSVAPVSIKKEE